MSDINWKKTVTRSFSPLKAGPLIEYLSENLPEKEGFEMGDILWEKREELHRKDG